jgi:hypothetical protein
MNEKAELFCLQHSFIKKARGHREWSNLWTEKNCFANAAIEDARAELAERYAARVTARLVALA